MTIKIDELTQAAKAARAHSQASADISSILNQCEGYAAIGDNAALQLKTLFKTLDDKAKEIEVVKNAVHDFKPAEVKPVKPETKAEPGVVTIGNPPPPVKETEREAAAKAQAEAKEAEAKAKAEREAKLVKK